MKLRNALITAIAIFALCGAAYLLLSGPAAVVPPAPEPEPGNEMEPEAEPPPLWPAAPGAEPPAPPADGEASPVVILVRREDGSPVPRANVVRFLNGRLVDQQVSDNQGQAPFSPEKAADRIVVRAIGHMPLRAPYAPDEGRQVVVLPDREEVSGRIIVNGGSPREKVVLELVIAGDPPARANAVTDDAGRFRFRGVPEEWTGALIAPRGYEFTDPASSGERLPLSGLAGNLEVHLHRFAAITGYVVLGPGGRRVDGAVVRVHWEGERGEGTLTFRANWQGSFRAHAPSEKVRKLTLSAQKDYRGTGAVRIEIPVDGHLTSDVDLGEVVLARTRTLEVRIRDRAGEAVEGAVVRGGKLTSRRTDKEGRTTITVNPEDRTLVAVALGYRFAEMPVPSGDLAEIVLEKGALLTVRVLTPTGAPAGGVAVRLGSDRPVFGGDEDLLEAAGASSTHSSRTGSGQHEFTYRPDENGELELSGFVEGAQFRLVVLDSLLPEPLHEAAVAITTDDHRTLDIEVPEANGTVEGQVVDEAGAPVARAVVRVLIDPDRSRYAFSDDDGGFRVDALRGTRVHVVVTKEGRAPALLENVPVSGKPLTITLALGREVVVRVVDPEGRVVSGAIVPGGDPDGQGGFRIGELPTGRVTLGAVAGGREYRIEHDTREPSATITVPVHGSARARWNIGLERPVAHRLRLVPVGDEGAEVAVRVDFVPDKRDYDVLVPAVLPGGYRASLEFWDDGTNDWAPWLGVPEVTVRPNETTEISLSR